MRKAHLWLLAVSVAALLSLPVAAQTTTPTVAPALPAAEDILTRIPADCLGFVAVRNVGDFGAKIDKFLADINVAKMLPGSVLPLLKGAATVGDGFNDNGGAALVFLDPAQFGLTIEAYGSSSPPIVFLLPGNNPKLTFANWQPTEEAGYVKLRMPDGDEGFAKPLGGYTILGNNKQMVDAVAGSAKPVAGKIGPDHRDVIAKSDVAAYADMKTLAPILNKAIDGALAEMKQAGSGMPPPLQAVMSLYGSVLPFY